MTLSSTPLATFAGQVECRRPRSGPLGLLLIGRSAERPETVWLAFQAQAPPDLPALLDAPQVEHRGPQAYTIRCGTRCWSLSAPHVHVHRDVAAAFYAAVPPRRVPLMKRLLWRVGLAAVASPIGRYWLARRSNTKTTSQ